MNFLRNKSILFGKNADIISITTVNRITLQQVTVYRENHWNASGVNKPRFPFTKCWELLLRKRKKFDFLKVFFVYISDLLIGKVYKNLWNALTVNVTNRQFKSLKSVQVVIMKLNSLHTNDSCVSGTRRYYEVYVIVIITAHQNHMFTPHERRAKFMSDYLIIFVTFRGSFFIRSLWVKNDKHII